MIATQKSFYIIKKKLYRQFYKVCKIFKSPLSDISNDSPRLKYSERVIRMLQVGVRLSGAISEIL